ncbi:MAG TPA: aldo/keto reductase [Rhodanobacteraceae bacterium]|nr:aldo/keto reductase [Rhodanobacteraceae bacterium]
MLYRRLGSTDVQVPEIGLGCSAYWGHRAFSERQAIAVVEEAFAQGINFFDTGHNYANFNAEPRLGRALRALLRQVDRAQLVISSKAGSLRGSTRLTHDRARREGDHDYSPDAIEASCRASIANLGCGYLDIFQLHAIGADQLTAALLERLADMRRAGLYRLLGINSHSGDDLRHLSAQRGPVDMVLLDYNALQQDREPVIAALAETGIGVVAGTALAQGHLVRRRPGSLASGAWFWYLARALLKPGSRRLARAAAPLREALAAIPGMTPAQAAVAYVLGNAGVASCLVGTTQPEHLRELALASGLRLPEAGRQAIRQAYARLPRPVSR